MLPCGQQGAEHYNNTQFPTLGGVEKEFKVGFSVCVNILEHILGGLQGENNMGGFKCSDCF